MPDILFVLDLDDLDIIYINNRIEQLLGYDAMQVYEQGLPFFKKALHPEDYERLLLHAKACKELTDNAEKEIELCLKSLNGEWLWFRIRNKAFKQHTDGSIWQTIGIAQCIQEQVNAQEIKQHNESLLRKTEEVGNLGSYEIDLLSMQFHLSDGLYRLFGYAPQGFEPTPEFIDAVSHPDDVVAVREVLERVRKDKEPFEYCRRIYLPNGEMRHLYSRGRVVCNAAGEAVMLRGIVEDVTTRVRTDQILDSLYEVCFELNHEFKFTYANRQAFQVWNKTADDIIGKSIWEVFPELEGSQIGETLIKAAKEQIQLLLEAYCPAIESWIFLNVSPSPTGLIVLHFDISEQVAARQEIQKQQEQFKILLENTPDVITRWNSDLRMIFANRAFEAKNGLPNNSQLGKTYLEMGQPESIALPLMAKLQRVFDTATQTEHYEAYPAPDGEAFFYTRMIPELAPDGSVQSVLAIARDITDLKKTELELKVAFSELARSTATIRKMNNGSVAGVFLLESVRDEKGIISDFVIKGLNKASEAMLQRKEAELLGRKLFEEYPLLKEAIFDDYVKVVESGVPLRRVQFFKELNAGSWFDISAIKNGDGFIVTFYDVTDLKKAEEALRQSEEKYRTLFESVSEGFCIIEVLFDQRGKPHDYRFLEVNPAFERHTDLKNATGKTMRELAPEHEDHWFEVYGKVALSGEPVRFEGRAEQLNRWYNVSAYKFGAPESPLVAVLFKDITKRKEAEHELKKSKELLQGIFNSSLNSISVLKSIRDEQHEVVDFEYVLANRAKEEQSGTDLLTGKRLTDLHKNYKKTKLFDMLKEVVDTEEPKNLELYYPYEGYDNWFHTSAVKFGDGVVLFAEDITARKLSELESTEKAHFIQQITETTPDVLVVFDMEHKQLSYVNHNLSAFLGYEADELNEMNTEQLKALVYPEDAEKAAAYHYSFLQAKDEDLLEAEFRLQTKQGEVRWYHVRGRVFKRNQQGHVKQYLSILRDVNEEKEVQKSLLEAEKLSVKGAFARTIAHEVRGPLVNINLALEMLQKEQALTEALEQGKPYIDIIANSSRRIDNFITELLSASKAQAGAYVPTNLSALVEDTIAMAQDRLYLKSIKVVRNFEGACVISADRERLKIAVLNIVHNAIEAMEEDKGVLELIVRHKQQGVELVVRDNGCGMNEEQLNKMFDAYYTSKPSGLGVGLANVQSILKDHGATISVESKPGRGTAFHVLFGKA